MTQILPLKLSVLFLSAPPLSIYNPLFPINPTSSQKVNLGLKRQQRSAYFPPLRLYRRFSFTSPFSPAPLRSFEASEMTKKEEKKEKEQRLKQWVPWCEKVIPTGKFQNEKKKKCCLQPVFNFFEEHSSLFHCNTQLGVVGVLFLYHSWSPVLQFLTACRSSICSLFSFVSFFFPPSFLQLCFSSNLPFSWCCGLLLLLLLLPSPAESAVAFIAHLLLRLPFLPLSSRRPYLSTVWWQFIYSPSLLLMHEPVSSHSAAPHLSLYYFTSFIVSFPPPLCCSYRTLTFSQFLSSLLFLPISSAFLSLSTFHLHSFNSEKVISIMQKVC